MKRGCIERSGGTSIPRVWAADTWWSRARGLLARPALAADGSEALLIRPCASVHTIGMVYPLDLVFLTRDDAVLEWRENVRPYRAALCRRAAATIEFHCGALDRLQPQRGEHWHWRATALAPSDTGAWS
ncbi:DUF192 domain-containing protein [Xanthomonas translucens]|uniref:DUF192 domain-containing protein n=1 Tax=Xanthomonas campestris pv. translucens TaxID=343 RepID=UPI0019D52076|nr:DUF192 domain-containing protein [Xanthomonas translucens]QSQ30596.1 DUF192 domain-containing protein [Xanthomonas translucens pv. translucens]